MLDEARAKKNGALTKAAKGWAVPEAQAARTIERAKALKIAPTAAPAAQRAAKERPNFRTLDRLSRALLARATQGISPAALAETWTDWALHLASAAGKRLELAQRAAMTMARFGLWLPGAASGTNRDPLIEPAPSDKRFADPAWSQWPFSLFAQSFLSTEAWWAEATRNVPGFVDSREAEVAFMMRALIDVVSPSNIPWLTAGRRPEPRSRGGQLVRRPRPEALGQAARGGGKVRGRTERRGHAGQGRLPQ